MFASCELFGEEKKEGDEWGFLSNILILSVSIKGAMEDIKCILLLY